MTAASAYQTWRQFSGGTKASPGSTPNGSYQAQQIGRDVQVGPSVASQLAEFASSAANVYGQYQKVQKDGAEVRVNDWMKGKTMTEYRQAMAAGNVPFQDDTLAMGVLHNKSAYMMALQVEQDIEGHITAGKYKTVEEADKARVDALGAARGEYALTMGISPDDKAFKTGFDRDDERRRDSLMRLQTDVTNKRLQLEAKIISKAEIIAPLPEVIKGMGPAKGAQYIISVSKQANELGQTRSDTDSLELISHAMESLQDTPGGYQTLTALGAEVVPFGGSSVALRDVFGGGKFDLLVAKAQQSEYARDGQRSVALQTELNTAAATNDDVGLRSISNRLLKESGGMMTPEVEQVQQTLRHVQQKQQKEAVVAQQQLAEQVATDTRLNAAMRTLGGVITGQLDGAGVSTNYTDLGLEDRAERSKVEQRLIEGYPEGPTRDAAILRLAATVPDGYAANAIKGQVDRGNADWQVLVSRLNAGADPQTLKLSPGIDRVRALAQVDQSALYGATEKPAFMTALEIGESLGIDPLQVASAEAKWKSLPEKQRTDTQKLLGNEVLKIKMPMSTQNQDTLRTMAGQYMMFGMEPATAVKEASKDFQKQHIIFGTSGVVHKSFFALQGNEQSVQAGESAFTVIRKEGMTKLGIDDDKRLFIQYDKATQRVILRNLSTGDSLPVTQQELRDRYSKMTEAAAAKKAKDTRVVIDALGDKRVAPIRTPRAGRE